jgi:glucuronokinase
MKYARGVARAEVPARSALVGNPSDGFGGATIALTLDELTAVVQAEPAMGIELEAEGERVEFESLADLVRAGERGEYPPGGPLALLMAATKRFVSARPRQGDTGLRLHVVSSSIPPRVGLAGSSAVVIGALRALGELFGEEIPREELPLLALACETQELAIPAGLQDRVVQTYGGLVFMDFEPDHPQGGRYQALDPDVLPPLFVAWLADAEEDSGMVHRETHERFDAGDPQVKTAMAEIAALAQRALTPLTVRDSVGLGVLMERNFELRRALYDLDPRHVELIETARGLGAPANYTGSGGAIIGIFRDDDHLAGLREAMTALGCELLVRRPTGAG